MRKLFGLALVAMLFLSFFGLLGLMGSQRSEAAWMQGYLAGQQAAGVDGEVVVPDRYQGQQAFPGGHGFSTIGGSRLFLPAFGLLFMCFLPLALVGGLFLFFGPRRSWHKGRNGGHRPPWARHMPPWMYEHRHQGDESDGDPAEKSPEDLIL